MWNVLKAGLKSTARYGARAALTAGKYGMSAVKASAPHIRKGLA